MTPEQRASAMLFGRDDFHKHLKFTGDGPFIHPETWEYVSFPELVERYRKEDAANTGTHG